MDTIKETGSRRESSANRGRRSRRPRKGATVLIESNEDGSKARPDRSPRGAPNRDSNRRDRKRERQSSASTERKRKRTPSNKEERRAPKNEVLTAVNGGQAFLAGHPVRFLDSRRRADVVSEEDEVIDRQDRRNNNNKMDRSKRRSLRSASVHDDSTGHYRIRTGAIIGNRYEILRELGLGTFGRVVECLQLPDRNQDRGHRSSREPDRHVAIKIVRNVKRYYESAVIEARIISEANRRGGRGRTHCVQLHDTFRIDGHFCLVFESLGPSLYDFLKRNNYQPFPIVCVQDFTVQLLETLEFLHGIRMIHTDLKIENILLMNDREINYRNQKVPESTRIKIIDFGGACYDSDKKSSVINTRQYRAPEVMLGTGWSMPSDMWSAGCILAELYTGELLFATHDDVEHLALIEKKIGLFPRRMVNFSKDGPDPELARTTFDSTGLHLLRRVLTPEHFSFVRRAQPLETHIKPEDDWFLYLLRRILVIDPHERATAHEALQYLRRIRRDVVRCT